MTQEQFDNLPGLLSRSQFIAATGLSHEKIKAERDAGLLPTWTGARRNGRKRTYQKFWKKDAARLGGFILR